MQRFLVLVCLFLGLASVSQATIVAQMRGEEQAILKDLFDSAQHSLLIRCASISDPVLVDALRKARRRGVVVRILVDEPEKCVPGLISKESASFLRVVARADASKGYFENQSAVFVDSDRLWNGVKRWESAAWTKQSTLIIDQRFGTEDCKQPFLALWKRTPRWGTRGVQSRHELPTTGTNGRAGLRALPGLHELWRRLL